MKHKIECISESSTNTSNRDFSYYVCSCGWEYTIPYPAWVVSRDAFHRMKLIEHVLEAENLCEFPKIQEELEVVENN